MSRQRKARLLQIEEIRNWSLNNQRQHPTFHILKRVLPYALCLSLSPVSAASASIFRMDSISPSYLRINTDMTA